MTRAPYLTAPLALALIAAPAQASPHLFVDRGDIAHTAGIQRVIQPPAKLAAPITSPSDRNFQPWSGVVRVGPDRWRLYYNALEKDAAGLDTSQAAVLASHDGIHWDNPRLLSLPTPVWGASVLRDQGAFKYLWWDKGMRVASSRDGINWSAPDGLRADVSDIVSWTRFHGRYVATVKMMRSGYKVGGRNADAAGTRRVIAVTTSRDGEHWTRPRDVFAPSRGERAATEYYGLGGMIQRGGLLIGFVRVLRDDLPATPGGPVYGIGYTTLAWSRDGVHWRRDERPFLDRSSSGWDHAMAWADAQVPVGKQTYVYYGGYRSGHKINRDTERQLGLARMPLDRYVARHAGPGGGTLVTRPMSLRGLVLNARVRGSMTVELRQAGRVVASCRVPAGNYVYRRACSLPSGRFAVRFVMRDADLYGLQAAGA